MAFPTYHEATNTAFPTWVESHPVDMPATVNAGDLLLMFFVSDTATGAATTPAGWS